MTVVWSLIFPEVREYRESGRPGTLMTEITTPLKSTDQISTFSIEISSGSFSLSFGEFDRRLLGFSLLIIWTAASSGIVENNTQRIWSVVVTYSNPNRCTLFQNSCPCLKSISRTLRTSEAGGNAVSNHYFCFGRLKINRMKSSISVLRKDQGLEINDQSSGAQQLSSSSSAFLTDVLQQLALHIFKQVGPFFIFFVFPVKIRSIGAPRYCSEKKQHFF